MSRRTKSNTVATLSRISLMLAFVTGTSYSQIENYQPVTDQMLNDPEPGEWLNWRGSLNGWGYSELDQINTDNVDELELVWAWAMDDTGSGQSAPIVYDGIMYLPGPRGVIQALDGATGDLVWEYRPGITPSIDGSDIALTAEKLGEAAMPATAYAGFGRGVHKNIAIYKDKIFASTENASILALDARTGLLVWETPVAQAGRYFYTSGPIIANGIVVTGLNGCDQFLESTCVITGHDPDTGEELWRTSTVAMPGEPGGDTWGGVGPEFRAGGDSWIAGSYDPEKNLVYIGTAQPKPWASAQRGFDDAALYTNSTLAINPDNGEIVWYYQHIPGDTHDMDEVFETVLVDIDGEEYLFKMGKLAILWQLDRSTGEFVKATDYGYQNILDVDPLTGEISYRDGMIPRLGVEIDMCPSTSGFKSWRAMAYSPQTSALYIPITFNCVYATFGPMEMEVGGGGRGPIRRVAHLHPDTGTDLGELLVVDVPSGDVKWRHRQRAPINTATLTTAGGLLFVGDWDRYVYAFDAESGEILWRNRTSSSVQGFPVTYSVGDTQYVAFPLGVAGASWSSSTPRTIAPDIKPPYNGNGLYVYALGSRND